jgi:hypothetical protein
LLIVELAFGTGVFATPKLIVALRAKAGNMVIIDRFLRRGSNDSLPENCDRVDAEQVDPRKIIDFESARQAFERDRPMPRHGAKQEFRFLSSNGMDRSGDVVESVVAIVLILMIGLSLLLGMIWGF